MLVSLDSNRVQYREPVGEYTLEALMDVGRSRLLVAVFITGIVLVACGDTENPPLDAGSDASSDAGYDGGIPCNGPPGLYINAACTMLAPGILEYRPRFALWSDATVKDRFISIPEQVTANIDTSDPDGWVFPTGTRIWKNFSLGGVRLETRLLEKTGVGVGLVNWSARTFQWSSSQDEVVEVFDGSVAVLGTDHDIPAVALCKDCHAGGGQPDFVLGFGSVQLNHSVTDTTLQDLDSMGVLTAAVPSGLAEVPGDAVAQQALGTLHANCGHCHGGTEAPAGLMFFVDTGLARVEDSAVYTTAVNVSGVWGEMGSNIRIDPGSPSTSTVIQRMMIRDSGIFQMPPLATDVTDPTGIQSVTDWINTL